MPEDATRKLLKVFGVAVTECEDALAALTAALRDPASSGAGPAAALEAYGKAAHDLAARWAEVSRLIFDYHARAQEAAAACLRTRSA
ncbi:MAG: hypothetical protein ACRELA_21995 [Candidatus Rokuibacteriota bacterium]